MHPIPAVSLFAALAVATAWLAGCDRPAAVPATRVITLTAPQALPPGHPPVARGALAGVIESLGIAVRATPEGLGVAAVDLDGPAGMAGVQVGDVIAGVNGTAAADAQELQRMLEGSRGTLHLDLRRAGSARQVAVKLADPAALEAAWTPLGLQVRDLPDSAREALGLSHGVMVTKVRAPADRTRILPGDVIVAVGQDKVRSAEEFGRLASGRRAGAVGLHVRRADADLFIPLEPAEGRNAGTGSRDGDASRGGGAPRAPEERYRKRAPIDRPLRT